MENIKIINKVSKFKYSNKKYNGFKSSKIQELLYKIDEIQNDINNIRNQCKHEFQLTEKGPYHDYFNCRICGMESKEKLFLDETNYPVIILESVI